MIVQIKGGSFMNKFRTKMMYALPVVTVAGSSMVALAADGDGATANAALVTGATNAVAQVTANIQAVIPLALSVLGMVMAIRIGIRVFKSLTNTSAK